MTPSIYKMPPLPLYIIEAVAREEGFYASGATLNRPQRNNNPGDLEYHPWQSEYNAFKGSDPRFAHFDTVENGFACLHRLFTFKAYRGLTIREMAIQFAPGNENNSFLYAKNVAAWTQLTLDTVIDNHLVRPAYASTIMGLSTSLY